MQSTSYATNSLGGVHSAEPNISTSRENIKTHFVTREGVYKQMTISEYSRPNRVPLNQGSTPVSNAPVRVSFLTVPVLSRSVSGEEQNKLPENNGHLPNHSCCHDQPSTTIERICFNVGRELYVYDYGSIHSASDLTKPIDKRVYKGTYPTCHDFNQQTATLTSCTLIIGFSAGQIQLIDPLQKEYQMSRLFNEDRSIDKSSVTCLRWVPGQPQLFIASHASGNMYVYNEEYACNPNPPAYQLHKQGENYSVHVLKSKQAKNPVQRWIIGEGAINQFEFSGPDAKFMATCGQDGFLRVFNYQTMELIGFMKSYFGGLLCLAWSPDLKLIATGGEDDLLTVYSVTEKRIVCRGQGHKSWISHVAFDPYTSSITESTSAADFGLDGNMTGSTDDLRTFVTTTSINFAAPTSQSNYMTRQVSNSTTGGINSTHSTPTATVNLGNASNSFSSPLSNTAIRHSADIATLACAPSTSAISNVSNLLLRSQKDSLSSTSLAFCGIGGPAGVGGAGYPGICYRIGTVGHDTQLCLWDLTEDILKNPMLMSQHNLAGFGPSTSRSRNTTIIPIGLQVPPMLNSTENTINSLSPNDYSQVATPCSSDAGTETSRNPDSKEKKNKLKLHKRGFSFGTKWGDRRHNSARLNGSVNGGDSRNDDPGNKIFGTQQCPRMNQAPIIEPLVCKKIAHERLTVLNFREDCLVTACQEGFVCTWARPGKIINRRSINSPVPTNPMSVQGGTNV